MHKKSIADIDVFQVSIVIPCYNQGASLQETLDSVFSQTFEDYEVIIVNDGSDDSNTLKILQTLCHRKLKIITTENRGLASARNRGITEAQGTYILPLDADDKILPTYLERAVPILREHANIGIVYCRASLFGSVEGEWKLPEYSLEAILLENMIFCSALFRKEDWRKVGGFDCGMKYGWEDYEFWIALIALGKKVFQIDEVLFCYRVSEDSMVRSKELWQKTSMLKRIFNRHRQLFVENIDVWINALHSVRDNYHVAQLYIDTGSGMCESESICRKVDCNTTKLNFNVKPFKSIEGIRFDPLDSYLICSLRNLKIKGDFGETELPLKEVSSNAILKEDSCFYFNTKDPQIYLTNTFQQKKIEKISFELSYHAIGDAALLSIIKKFRKKSLFNGKPYSFFLKVKKIFARKNKVNLLPLVLVFYTFIDVLLKL